VGETDRELPTVVVGTWRDVPFGAGTDYDDGLAELPMFLAGDDDTRAPALLGVRARDSESVVASFDEAISAVDAGVVVRVTGDGGELSIVEVFVGQPLPNQVVVRTGTMELDAAYSLLVGGVRDAAGNDVGAGVTGGFTSPASLVPFSPLVDEQAPTVLEVVASSPTEVTVRFSERVATGTVALDDFALSHTGAGTAPALVSVRTSGAGQRVILTTEEQERQAPYELAVSGIEDVVGNVMDPVTLAVAGFGEFDPPEVEWARAITPNRVAVKFNEPVTPGTAGVAGSYSLNGLDVTAAQSGASDDLRAAAFNTIWAPLAADLVILSTTQQTGGTSYTVTVDGVEDLSGNASSGAMATFTGVAQAPTVDVLLTYLVSDTAAVEGVGPGGSPGTPNRSLSPGDFDSQREGLFVVGTALTESGADPLTDHAFTLALGGYPPDGAPMVGEELQATDDGTGGDVAAGDRVYSVLVPDVPLGSTLSWKGFASFTTDFAAANPQFPGASFADAPLGPGAFSDGQEFPGNDNAVYLVADIDGDGKVVIENLFGDEITFKRKTGFAAFHMAVDVARRRE
jgi:hypothetical protein